MSFGLILEGLLGAHFEPHLVFLDNSKTDGDFQHKFSYSWSII